MDGDVGRSTLPLPLVAFLARGILWQKFLQAFLDNLGQRGEYLAERFLRQMAWGDVDEAAPSSRLAVSEDVLVAQIFFPRVTAVGALDRGQVVFVHARIFQPLVKR